MKIAVITTKTLHHIYFAREIANKNSIKKIFVEKNILKAPFKTYHSFEDKRDKYEKEFFFQNQDASFSDFADTVEVNYINNPEVVLSLKKINPDIIIVFGTGKISKDIIGVCPEGIINLHGGDPEKYRGLDSHLWAIYHNDFESIVATLHRVNKKLDDGEIIFKKPINLMKGMELYQIRRHNTQLCVEIVNLAIEQYKEKERFIYIPQREKGRYYSFMPSDLKVICVSRFRQYVESIK